MKKTSEWDKRGVNSGFTLLEVMISVAILAIALVSVYGSQSQSLSMANEAKFNTTAALLAQAKIAEIEAYKEGDLSSSSGDFGEDFPDYFWDLVVGDVPFTGEVDALENLRQIDLTLSYNREEKYSYKIRLFCFAP